MKNKDLLLERILLNMKYDSKKTLSENKILLNESDPKITFVGPHPQTPSTMVKWTTNGKILSKVSQKIDFLKTEYVDKNVRGVPPIDFLNGKKHLHYDDGKQLKNWKYNSLENCIKERFAGGKGKVKSWDYACLQKRTETINELESQRFNRCLNTITSNQSLMNMPFTIEQSGQKTDNLGESANGDYQILFFLEGENCTYGGFNYFLRFDWSDTSLNWDYPLKPLRAEFIKKQEPKPVVKKVEQKVETPKLTLDQQKKWCVEHGNVWSNETNSCVGPEITIKASEQVNNEYEQNKIKTKGTTKSTNTKGLGGYSFDLD
jgi:hypothetical protein